MFAEEILKATTAQVEVRLVSTDVWRDSEYYAKFKPENEKQVRIRALEATHSFLKKGWSVIHDDTNYYSSMRHELFSLAANVECSFGVVYVKTPIEIALEWNTKRDVIIPENAVRKIHEKLAHPGEKYAWDHSIYEVDLSITDVEKAAEKLMEVLKDLPPITPRDVSEAGEREIYDAYTREVVTNFLEKEHTCRNDPEVSKIRKSVLNEALEKGWSIEITQEELWEKLKELTIRASK
jgi:O-phosphoseryl-tRNA(Sec) kinase